jgi:hypothetical protein
MPASMGAAVFLGPSLPVAEARRALDTALYLPPVQRGDVYELVSSRPPKVIGIVDGLFDRAPAVLHKEILYALSKGVRVVGGASMGALRAAELEPFGMEGVGRIFERFRSGEWEADDEVAVLHGTAEDGFRVMSDALASLRLALEDAREAGIIQRATEVAMVAAAKAQFYAERSWASLFAHGERLDIGSSELANLRRFVAQERPDAKRADALAVLARVRDRLDRDEPFAPPDFDFEATDYWEHLIARHRSIGGSSDSGLSHDDLRRHVRFQPGGAEAMRGAALLHFLAVELRRRGAPLEDGEVERATLRFRRRLGLLSAARMEAWLEAQQLTSAQLRLLIELEVAFEHLLQQIGPSVRGMLPLELKRRGEFGHAAHTIGRKQKLLADAGVASLTLEDAGIGFADLLAWYQARYVSIEGELDDHARSLGFRSVREFVSELLLEYRLSEDS